MLSRLAEGFQIPDPRRQCALVCLRVEEPRGGGGFQRGPCACLSGSGVEFHYYMIELRLLHRPHPSPVLGPGTAWGCLPAGGQGRATVGLEQ